MSLLEPSEPTGEGMGTVLADITTKFSDISLTALHTIGEISLVALVCFGGFFLYDYSMKLFNVISK